MTRNNYLLLILFIYLFKVNGAQSQEYIVGGDFDYAPFSFIDKTGKASGLDIDILNAISAETGITFNYHLSEWDSALKYIKSGETDIISGIIFSEEREEFVDFTYPIHTGYYSIFIRKDLPFKEISDLYNYKLLVLKEDISIRKFLVPMGLYNNYIVAKSLPEALAGLEWGRADYVLAPYSVGMSEITKNKYKNIQVKGPTIIPSIYCLAVKKGNTRLLAILNKGISNLRTKGELSKIQAKWLIYERDDFRYKRITKVIGIVFVIGAVILILVFIWVWQLRMQIKKKTLNINLKNQELKKLNAEKDKFFSIVAHDLRSPFNSIIGYSNILIEDVQNKELEGIEKFAQIINDSSKKAMDLLTNLIEWSQSQTGRLIFKPENFDLNKSINEIVCLYADIAMHKSIIIEQNIPIGMSVYADKAMINTILRNLISNAIKYTSQCGNITIIGILKQDKIEISIKDTGVGMSKSLIDKLFVLDTNYSTPGTKNEQGTGLGLMLCKDFVDKHQGEIWVESELGKGSTFNFTIPHHTHQGN